MSWFVMNRYGAFFTVGTAREVLRQIVQKFEEQMNQNKFLSYWSDYLSSAV